MTALVSIEKIEDLNQKVTFVKSDYDKLKEQDASGSTLKRNKAYTYRDLLYGLVLESGADCANALARLTYGNEKDFVAQMNEKAQELGMTNSKFANPIGLDNKNNYSTVNDIALLLKEDLRNEELNVIINSMKYKLSDGTVIHHTMEGYMHAFKINIPGIKGGKTGYETKAGYALASSATRNNTTLLLVTSRAKNRPDHIKDAKTLYDYFFNNYSYKTIIDKDEVLVSLDAKNLNRERILIKADEDIKYYLKNDYNKNDITTKYEGIETISLNNRKGQKIGNLKIMYKNDLIMNYPIILEDSIFPSNLVIGLSSGIVFLIVLLFIVIKYRKRTIS